MNSQQYLWRQMNGYTMFNNELQFAELLATEESRVTKIIIISAK